MQNMATFFAAVGIHYTAVFNETQMLSSHSQLSIVFSSTWQEIYDVIVCNTCCSCVIFNRVLVDLDILQHFTTPTSSIDGFA